MVGTLVSPAHINLPREMDPTAFHCGWKGDDPLVTTYHGGQRYVMTWKVPGSLLGGELPDQGHPCWI